MSNFLSDLTGHVSHYRHAAGVMIPARAVDFGNLYLLLYDDQSSGVTTGPTNPASGGRHPGVAAKSV